MLLGTLNASLIRSALLGRAVIRASEATITAGKIFSFRTIL